MNFDIKMSDVGLIILRLALFKVCIRDLKISVEWNLHPRVILLVKQYLNKDSEGVIVTNSKEGLLWLKSLINTKVPSVRTVTHKSPPTKWTALNLNVGSWPIDDKSDSNSAVPLLSKILKVNGITPLFPHEIKVDKIKTNMEPGTGNILKQTIRFAMMKSDFENIKAWMNINNKNYFDFFQKMSFYLMAPNGKIIEWYPKPIREQNLSTDRAIKPQKKNLDIP